MGSMLNGLVLTLASASFLAGGVANHPCGEDAYQEALLKTLKGRPEIFQQSRDDVVRYLRTSASRNLVTEVKRRDRAVGTVPLDDDHAPVTVSREPDPATDVECADLTNQLHERLGAVDRQVLSARLDGHWTERALATVTGLSRHAVSQASARIAHALEALLA